LREQAAAPTPPERPRAPRPRVDDPPPAPPPEPAPETPPRVLDWTGSVRSRDGAAVADAEVELLDDQDERVDRGRADGQGAFTIAGHGMLAAKLVARHPEFETTSVSVARRGRDETPESVTIVVGPGAVIEGDVVLPSGQTPSVPIRVAAWPSDGPYITRTIAQRAAQQHPLVPATVTDGAGRFRIGGLRPGRSYNLIGGSAGYAHVQGNPVPPPTIAGSGRARVVVAPVYVLHLRVRGPDGGPLRSSPVLVSWPGISWTGSAGEVDITSPAAPGTAWTDLPGSDAALANWGGRTFVLFLGPAETDRLGPIQVTAGATGYVRKVIQAWAVRAAASDPAGQEIRLDPATADWGRLRIRLDDGGTGFARAFDGLDVTSRVLGRAVVLTPADGPAVGTGTFLVPLREWPADGLVADGIPAGRWRVRLDLPLAAPSSRASVVVDVTADVTADVTLEVKSWSALEVVPTLAGDPSAPYTGPLSVTLRRAGTNVSAMAAFRGPPYRMVGVEPRAFDVDVSCQSGTAHVERVDARACQIERVEVVLQPAPR
jgi:hypothetical protein